MHVGVTHSFTLSSFPDIRFAIGTTVIKLLHLTKIIIHTLITTLTTIIIEKLYNDKVQLSEAHMVSVHHNQ